MLQNLKKIDSQLTKLIELETKRQQETIDLIPSECLVPPAVLEALASSLSNKYSEGEAGRRYYPGNQYIDQIEKLAQQRARQVFALGDDWQVNVQSLSGAPANLAIYFALLEPGETIMGMNLFAGGHLSHGHKAHLSGQVFKSVQYGVGEDGLIDFEEVSKLAQEAKPKIIVSGFTAYPHQVDFGQFGRIAQEAGSYHLADISHIAGLIAAGLHPSPFPYADVVMTTTHKTLNGPRAAIIFFKKELAEKINRSVFPGIQGGPHNNKIAALAAALKIALSEQFREIQGQIIRNSKALAGKLIETGFKLVGNGTATHLMLVDLRNKEISGREAQDLLEKAGIIVNRNSIPSDQSPFNPSGLRPGTPSITFRGMKEKEAEQIGEWIDRVISKKQEPAQILEEVKKLTQHFPLPYDY